MTILEEDEYNITVEASMIDKIHIYYKCPFCYKLKNGRVVDSPFNTKTKRIYSSAKPNTHFHGSGGDLLNRIEHRVSHCSINDKKGVWIVINDNTKRN